MRTSRLMILIGLLAALMAVPFQYRTGVEEIYRFRADRHNELATQYRTAERRARARGDYATAETHRLHAEWIEQQGWIYRRGSYHRWEWPDRLWPSRERRSP